MPLCPGCGNYSGEVGDTCPMCGATIGTIDYRNTCPRCGKHMDYGTRVCPRCGQEVRWLEIQVTEETKHHYGR